MKRNRNVEVVVISNLYLSTDRFYTKQLLQYLKNINPKILVLNGYSIGALPFRNGYVSKTHLKVINKIISFAANGVKVYCITGMYKDALKKLSGVSFGNIYIVNKLVLDIDGKKCWFFNDDVLDVSIKYMTWLAKFGGFGYDYLFQINVLLKRVLALVQSKKYTKPEYIINNIKSATRNNNDYESAISKFAIRQGYNYVVSAYIQQPKMAVYKNTFGKTMYLNPGSCLHNFTALEYQFKRWKLYDYNCNNPLPIVSHKKNKNKKDTNLIAAITVVNTFKTSK